MKNTLLVCRDVILLLSVVVVGNDVMAGGFLRVTRLAGAGSRWN